MIDWERENEKALRLFDPSRFYSLYNGTFDKRGPAAERTPVEWTHSENTWTSEDKSYSISVCEDGVFEYRYKGSLLGGPGATTLHAAKSACESHRRNSVGVESDSEKLVDRLRAENANLRGMNESLRNINADFNEKLKTANEKLAAVTKENELRKADAEEAIRRINLLKLAQSDPKAAFYQALDGIEGQKRPAARGNLQAVIDHVIRERQYADIRWGNPPDLHADMSGDSPADVITPIKRRVGEYIALMSTEIAMAGSEWRGHASDEGALKCVRNIAQFAIACLEQNGLPPERPASVVNARNGRTYQMPTKE